jgi:uncharacterized YigZ family protein
MRVPTGSATSELIIRRSRFIGGARYFDEAEHIKTTVQRVRDRYSGCDHVAYAFILGANAEVSGMSDDREPKGTAGRPMLEVLKGCGLTNTLVTVVRFFGGTKLGTGGLVRAYSDAARTALNLLKSEELIEKVHFSVRVPYGLYEAVRRLVSEATGQLKSEEFEVEVTLEGELPAEGRQGFENRLADLSGGAVEPVFLDLST